MAGVRLYHCERHRSQNLRPFVGRGLGGESGRHAAQSTQCRPTTRPVAVPVGAVAPVGTHMSDITRFSFDILHREWRAVLVANLTQRDGEELLALAPKILVQRNIGPLPLDQAKEALMPLCEGQSSGVIVPIFSQ